MQRDRWSWFILLFFGVLTGISVGCGPDIEQSKPLLPTPQAPLATVASPIYPSATPSVTEVAPTEASREIGVVETPVELESLDLSSDDDEPTIVAESGAQELRYRVNFIEQDDVLNIRNEPGAEFSIVGEYPLGATDIEVIGQGQRVGNSFWLPIEKGRTIGWVNSRYLVEEVGNEEFCDDSDSRRIVEKLLQAVESENGPALAELVEEGRDLRIRRHWWNPEVRLDSDAIPGIFGSAESQNWGVADGSGDPIVGSFASVIKPLLDMNMTGASEIVCGEILHGGTAGYVRLPAAYEGINFYSLFRPPGPDDFELDWGSWVVGIERWQGDYVLSFLVHYQWEI